MVNTTSNLIASDSCGLSTAGMADNFMNYNVNRKTVPCMLASC